MTRPEVLSSGLTRDILDYPPGAHHSPMLEESKIYTDIDGRQEIKMNLNTTEGDYTLGRF